MHSHRISFDTTNLDPCVVAGGSIPISEIMGLDYIRPVFLKQLRYSSLMFLSQLTSLNGNFLLKWIDLNYISDLKIPFRKIPKWFQRLERHVLFDQHTSRRLKLVFCTPEKALPSPLQVPDMSRIRQREWVALFHNTVHKVIIGRVRTKSVFANSVVVEHWLHSVDNNQVSPSYLKTIVQPCPGCDIHDPAFKNFYSLRPRNVSSIMCAAIYSCTMPITFEHCNKLATDRYELRPSLYELTQLATRHYERINNPMFVPLPISRPNLVTDTITENILSIRKRKEITTIRTDFELARVLEFYTDGSMRYHKSDRCTMGIGWIQTNADFGAPICSFSAQVQRFPSALRAEIYAVLSALCTAPPHCNVKIFTDNRNVVHGIKHILSAEHITPAHLHTLFEQNHLLWAAIHFILEEQDLILECEWVKAHAENPPNPYNDEADKLAKEGNEEDIFEFNTKFLAKTQHIISWSGIPVDMKARKLVAQIVKAKSFNAIFNSRRQHKVKQLTRQDQIDWTITNDLLSEANADGTTSFSQSSKKAFQVKCFTEELSTLEKLKLQRPDLYSTEWRCSTCGNENETYEHVWLCPARRNALITCIQMTQTSCVLEINSVIQTPLTDEQVALLVDSPTWSLIPDPDRFTFLETTKSVIHRNFVDLLQEFGCTYEQAAKIIVITFSGLFDLLQKVIWSNRCEDQIQAEHIYGIDPQSKRSGYRRTSSDQARPLQNESVPMNPRRQASLRSNNVCNEEWFVWQNDVCHYGGSHLNF